MSGEINILIEEIEAIAQQTRSQIASEAQQGASRFADATLDAGAFAGIPPGLAFHTQQANAQEVYLGILHGVVADLESFADALASNAANHRAVDESNADTMTAMEARRADEQAAAAAMSNVNEQYGDDAALQSQEVYDENLDEDYQPAESMDQGVDAGPAEPQAAGGPEGPAEPAAAAPAPAGPAPAGPAPAGPAPAGPAPQAPSSGEGGSF